MALYVKAFSLVLKTVSKPMAKSLKSFVVSQPELKKTCISMAQKINEVYSCRRVGRKDTETDDGRGKERERNRHNDERAKQIVGVEQY